MSEQVTVPWDQATVDALNDYQVKGHFHPYTCPNRGDGKHTCRDERGGDLGALLATPSGWICGECDYTQNWAHVSSLSARNMMAEMIEAWSRTPPIPVPSNEDYDQLVEPNVLAGETCQECGITTIRNPRTNEVLMSCGGHVQVDS